MACTHFLILHLRDLCAWQADPDLPSSAKDMQIMVNWMHAASHDMSCQLENSGRFQKDTGFVVGEQSEQLWSGTKVCVVVENEGGGACLLSCCEG